jgi:chemotaxis protein CheC
MTNTEDNSLLRYDALQEVVNIGGGNAATSLSQLIGKKVDMDVPTIDILEYEEVFQKIRSEDEVVRAVLMKLLGGEGSFLFVTEPTDAENLAKMMMPEGIDLSQEIIDSAEKELVNILVNSFLNAIMKMIDVHLITSVPMMTEDMFGSIISSVYMEEEQFDPEILILKNEFYSLGHKIEGSLYFVPKPGVLEKLLNQLGV